MRAFLAILDIGHLGKRTRPGDLGAAADLNGDGGVAADEREALLVVEYVGQAAAEIGRLGGEVEVWARGDYGWRHARARQLAAERTRCAYVQCHLNIGAQYGLVLHDHRSEAGKAMAVSVAGELGRAVPDLSAVRVEAASTTRWANAYNTIAGIFSGPQSLAGICYEPASLDVHSRLLTSALGPGLIGRSLAAGIAGWAL